MRILKIIFIGIMVSVFFVGQAYSAPKGNNGKANKGKVNNAKANKGKTNKGKSQVAKVNKGKNKSVSKSKGKSVIHKQQARRHSEVNRKREERNRSNISNKHFRRNNKEANKQKIFRGFNLMDSLNRARWSSNPKNDRAQGNMGKVDMQNPYGHDKDSDRQKKDRGRIVRESESLEDLFSIDFSSLEVYEDWLLNWMQRAIDEYWTNELRQQFYTFQEWEQMYKDHFFVRTDTSTGVIIDQRETVDYSLNFSGTEGVYEITTQLVSLEDYDSHAMIYNSDTGTYSFGEIKYENGEVVYKDSQEVVFNSETGSYEYSANLPTELVGVDSFYTELQVIVKDTTTGETYTQIYDKSLYLYRCPYGKVTDIQTGQAIVGAKIIVHYEDGGIVSLDKATNGTANNPQITDVTGRFGFVLQANRKYYMIASAEGYEDYKSGIFTEQWHELREDIKMTPKQEK